MRETVVETGAVRGIACGWPSITVYYGIPYAAPPVSASACGRLGWSTGLRKARRQVSSAGRGEGVLL